MPIAKDKQEAFNKKYVNELLYENKIKLLEPFNGAKKHHKMECIVCAHRWVATPISKRQNYKKYNSTGCPNCNENKKETNYNTIRAVNLQRLEDRGIIVLTEGYDGRTYLDYNTNPHLKIKVKNVNCGHTFECSPSNLLGAETECGICGPQKRAEPIIQWSKTNSTKWQETATEWEKYRNVVHGLTRLIYNKNKQKINPKNYPRGKAGVKGAYHLDHLVPVRFCFDNNIPPSLCAHVTNLQMVKWKSNITTKASIKGTLPPLFLPYVESGQRLKTIATEISDKLFPEAELFKQLNDIVITLYDPTTAVGIVIIPLDESHANMKIAHIAMETMQKNGIRPFIIFEDELKKPFILNKIQHYIGAGHDSLTRIHGRKCVIREVDSKTKSAFLNQYHIQGNDKAQLSYGAFHGDDLMAVMTFGKPRVLLGYKNKDRTTYDGIWELSRFATNTNYRIPGIASKLLSTFKKDNDWTKITSYADKRWSTGNLYDKLGFTMEMSNKPDYFYIIDGERRHRWNYRKDVLKETMDNYDPKLTEYQNMVHAGHWRLWDCGTLRYVLYNEK